MRDGGTDANRRRAVLPAHLAAELIGDGNEVGHRPLPHRPVEICVVDDEPRSGHARERLREVGLVPGRLALEQPPAVVVDGAGPAAVELGAANEVVLAPARRRRRHEPPVELVLTAGERGTATARERDAAAVRPRRGAQRETAFGGEAHPPAAGREHDLALGLAERGTELDLVDRPEKALGEPARIEATPDGQRVAGFARDDRRAERLEPVEGVVEPLDHERLKNRVAAGAVLPEVVERAVAPDDAAREQHRAADPRTLLHHDRLAPELAQPRSRHEAGHAGSRDEHARQWRENVGLCSTYSSFTRSGPHTNSASVFGASTTSSTSMPSSSASATWSSTESTSTPR